MFAHNLLEFPEIKDSQEVGIDPPLLFQTTRGRDSNLDLSKTLNNGYRLLLLRIEGYPGHFGVLLIEIHLLPLGFLAENVDYTTK